MKQNDKCYLKTLIVLWCAMKLTAMDQDILKGANNCWNTINTFMFHSLLLNFCLITGNYIHYCGMQ